MQKALLFVGLGALVILIGVWIISAKRVEAPTITNSLETLMTSSLTLLSPVFENGTSIPPRFTCDGENMSPPLAWSDLPLETKSLALTVHDPDVPKQLKPDGVFDHWTLFNIPPDVTEIATGGSTGTRGSNGTGKNQYTGPCPPKEYEPSEHRYVFKLYALDTELDLPEGATKVEVLSAIEGHVLGEAELVGKYRRQ